MVKLINSETSTLSMWIKCILAFCTSNLFITVIKAQDIPQAVLPIVYLPEEGGSVHLNGFTSATIVSQRADRYPANYHTDVQITIHGTFKMSLTVDVLDLADANANGDCTDFFQLFNYADSRKSYLSDKICGTKKPSTVFISSSNSVMLRFQTDSYNEGKGFRITYRRLESSSPVVGKSDLQGSGSNCPHGMCPATSSATSSLVQSVRQSWKILMLSLVSVVLFRYQRL